MTQTQTPTAEAGDVTTLREDQIDAAFAAYFDGEEPPHRLVIQTSIKARLARAINAALAASPAPRASAVPEELRRLSKAADAAKQASEDYAENNPGSTSEGFMLRMQVCDTRNAFRDAAVNYVRTLAAAPAAPPADGGTEGLIDKLIEAAHLCGSIGTKTSGAGNVEAVSVLRNARRDLLAAISPRTPAGAAGDLVTELVAKAEGQVSYWRERQTAEKCLENGISEDGETYTPIGDEAAWQGGYCNGRMSEADWWVSTLKAHATRPASPAPAASAGGEGEATTPGEWIARGRFIYTHGSTDTYAGAVQGAIFKALDTEASDAEGRTWSTSGSPEDNAAYVARLVNTDRRTQTPAASARGERARLANLINTRLLGVRPDEQDLELEDADWRLILAALAPAARPAPSPAKGGTV